MRKINYNKVERAKFDAISTLGDEGQSIEQQIRDMVNNETTVGIKETSPIIYTARKDGVLPEYDIRTDKWEIGQRVMGAVSGKFRLDRQERLKSTELQIKEQPHEN